MNLKNLQTTSFIWQTNLQMNLQTTWSQHGLVYHIFSVGHSDDQNIVETVNSINF